MEQGGCSWKVSCCSTQADNSLVERTNIIRAVHVRGMLVSFICVISANTCGNACPSNANAREWREREGGGRGNSLADVYTGAYMLVKVHVRVIITHIW